jgi:predicted polyphosphate/ATP-dependent NAD kinase
MTKSNKTLGLIINPVAGVGGRVGLKGSDGVETLRKALSLGAVPEAFNRTVAALQRLTPIQEKFELVTSPGEMGADAAAACGLHTTVIGTIQAGETTPADTRRAAQKMLNNEIDLLLFAGGDGTARDIYSAINGKLPVLGIPAGVKIHSGVYARNPLSAGELARLFLEDKAAELREAEVMDIDEDAFREGRLNAQLFGYMKIPYRQALIQGMKSGSAATEATTLEAIAFSIVDNMAEGVLYIIGPGTTTRPIAATLGLPKTLLGVDAILNRALVGADLNETQLLALVEEYPAKIVVTPIGGQGFIFGRGNQQISPTVIRKAGPDNVIVVSPREKIYALDHQPLLVDTGDPDTDKLLSGYTRVVVGYDEVLVYRVAR